MYRRKMSAYSPIFAVVNDSVKSANAFLSKIGNKFSQRTDWLLVRIKQIDVLWWTWTSKAVYKDSVKCRRQIIISLFPDKLNK